MQYSYILFAFYLVSQVIIMDGGVEQSIHVAADGKQIAWHYSSELVP